MEKRYFQYIAGEDAGEIKTLKDVICEDGITYLEFTDGELMNRDYVAPITTRRADLKNKFMVEISSRDNAWSIEEIKERTVKLGEENYAKNVPPIEDYINMDGQGEHTTVNSMIGGKRLVPPKTSVEPRPLPVAKKETYSGATEEELKEAYGGKTPSNIKTNTNENARESEKNIEDAVVVEENRKEEPVKTQQPTNKETAKPTSEPEKKEIARKPKLDTTDPVAILVGSSKKAEYELNVTLSIQLPQKSLYKIVSEQFDDGKEKFIQYILDGLDTTDIIKSIGEALKVSYES